MNNLTLLEGEIDVDAGYGGSDIKHFVLGVFDNDKDIAAAIDRFNKLQKNFHRTIREIPVSINEYILPYGPVNQRRR